MCRENCFFPELDWSRWKLVQEETHHDSGLGCDYRFQTWETSAILGE